jgi:hypothetical protein
MKLLEIIEPGDDDNLSEMPTIKWTSVYGAKYWRVHLWNESVIGSIFLFAKKKTVSNMTLPFTDLGK